MDELFAAKEVENMVTPTSIDSIKETDKDKGNTIYAIIKSKATVGNAGRARNIIPGVHGNIYSIINVHSTIDDAVNEIEKLRNYYRIINDDLNLGLQISLENDEDPRNQCLTISHKGNKMPECETMVIFNICGVAV